MANYRNRKLLDLAHRVQVCQNCGRHTGGCEPAHENGIESGKGFGIKAHDNRHAALCHDCHAWYDQGRGMDPSKIYTDMKDDKFAMWGRAHRRTYDLYWLEGWLQVAP